MQLDAVVQRRFRELAEKAERLAAARQGTDSDSFTIPAAPFYEWVTNVQNLLARAFGLRPGGRGAGLGRDSVGLSAQLVHPGPSG
jgi:hypothetical protein